MPSLQEIVSTTIRQRSGELARNIAEHHKLLERVMANQPIPTPPTFADRLRQFQARVEDACRVLRGEAYAVGYDEEEY